MKNILLHTFSISIVLILCQSMCPVLAQNIIFEDSFEEGTLDPVRWTANPAADGGIVEAVRQLTDVASIPRTGDYALAMGRSADGSAATINKIDLNLDLSGQEDVTMEFWLRRDYDETDEDDAIFLSVDGGSSFQKVLNLRPGDWGNLAYGQVVVDLGAAADFHGLELSGQTVVRIQQSGQDDFVGGVSYNTDGFFIDDVVVKGAPQYASLPFEDGFEADALGASWRVADSYNSDLTAPEAASQWGLVMPVRRITDVQAIPRTGDYALAMGRSADGSAAGANAIDLHLNLGGQEDVTMEFWLRRDYDETDEDDAIFLSVDGGKTFTEAFALTPGARENKVYEKVILDLDAMAQELQLQLTNRTVVRIQQIGEDDFVGGASYTTDGFFVDDLSVQGNVELPALIEDKTFSIPENATQGNSVANLATTDGEGNSLSYELLSQSIAGTFALSSSGNITVANADQLDYATNPVHTIEVEASNGERSTLATITINVTEEGGNENTAPSLADQSFTIEENSEAGTLVGEISATDAEGDALSFQITAGNTDEAFSMAEETGELIVNNPAVLDFETSPEFTLTVEVNDGQLSSKATINISLINIEEEGPTAIEDEIKKAIALYPNPAENYLYLNIPEKTLGGNLTIFSLKGEKLQEQSLRRVEERINIKNLPAGTYLIRIQKDDINLSFKVIKAE